jgi:hypothetical protein
MERSRAQPVAREPAVRSRATGRTMKPSIKLARAVLDNGKFRQPADVARVRSAVAHGRRWFLAREQDFAREESLTEMFFGASPRLQSGDSRSRLLVRVADRCRWCGLS